MSKALLKVVVFACFTFGFAKAQSMPSAGAETIECNPSILNELQTTAATGDARAEFVLGEFARIGHCQMRDYDAAARLLSASHKKGNVLATFALSKLYADPGFEERSAKRSVDFLREAAERDLVEAQHRLGVLLAAASQSDADRDAAIGWLNKAYQAGHGLSAASIGMYYERGMHGFPVEICSAYAWYSKAISVGFEPAEALRTKINEENDGLCALTN